jgi:glycine betaine catabolism A
MVEPSYDSNRLHKCVAGPNAECVGAREWLHGESRECAGAAALISKGHSCMTQLEKSLPSAWYRDHAYFRAEQEQIFSREWVCLGRAEEILAPAQHRVLEIAGQDILLLRKSDGEWRGFYNVCRHRGARLCADHGTTSLVRGGVTGQRIICPYHSWSYDWDGNLTITPFLNIDRTTLSLHPIGVESWGGFLFAHLSPENAPGLIVSLGAIPDRVKNYQLDGLTVGHRIGYDVQANWKLIAENYNECYHCGPVHPELSAIVPAFRENGAAGLDWDIGIAHRDGADTFTMTGTTSRRSFPGLSPDEQTLHKGEVVYPNLFISLARDHVAAFVMTPLAVAHTRIDCLFLFEPFEAGKPDFNPFDAVELWDITNRQDWEICERVQKGLSARVHDFGYYAPMEDMSLDMRRYVEARVKAPQA